MKKYVILIKLSLVICVSLLTTSWSNASKVGKKISSGRYIWQKKIDVRKTLSEIKGMLAGTKALLVYLSGEKSVLYKYNCYSFEEHLKKSLKKYGKAWDSFEALYYAVPMHDESLIEFLAKEVLMTIRDINVVLKNIEQMKKDMLKEQEDPLSVANSI